ncbi:MAG: BamA/TamA family outer membrane protein [Mariprofundaceae bacterium]|nr:BamA/TamA family outer membrane protein [Mariprofundaceae bacterium]
MSFTLWLGTVEAISAKPLLQSNEDGVSLLGHSMPCPEVVLQALKKVSGREASQLFRVRKNQKIIQNCLASQGFMDAKIRYADKTINHYLIEEGARWRVGSMNILPKLDQVYSTIPKRDSFFTTAAYEAGKNALLNIWFERGYLTSRFVKSEVLPNAQEKKLYVYWTIDIGERNHIADIQIEGNKNYSTQSILRLSGLKQGQVATAKHLRDCAERISRDIRFRSATVLARTDQIQRGLVPLKVTVVETPRFELLGNLGYSSDLGMSARAGFKDFGLMKGRFNADVQADVSDVKKGMGVMVSRPAWPTSRDATGIQSSYLKEDTAALRTTIWNAGVFVRREFRKYNYAKINLNEKWIQSTDVPMKLFEPSLAFRLDWRSYESGHLRDGWRVDGRVALPIALQGRGKWVSAYAGARFYVPFKKYFLLVPRVGSGMTFAIKGAVPKQLRQYLGGTANVRGYKLDSIGFTGPYGLAKGGRKSAYAGVDLVLLPKETFAPVLFSDMGRVWDVSPREQALAVSAGIGLIINTEIGSIRIDMAMPLRRFGQNLGSRWYFSLGEVL